MLHFGYIRWLAEKTDFSNNPTAMSVFTGIYWYTLHFGYTRSLPPNHSLRQQQRNRHESIYWYTLHLGSIIKAPPEFTDFSNELGGSKRNQTTMSAFTGIRCTLATLGGSQSNCQERIYRYTLQLGYNRSLPESIDLNKTQTAMSGFTGIRCTLATMPLHWVAPSEHRF